MSEWRRLRDRLKVYRQRLSRTRVARSLLVALVAFYIRLVYYTSRRSVLRDESLVPYLNGQANAIFAFWHGRLLLVPPFRPRSRAMHVLISHHNDGEIIAQVLACFDVYTVRGSSSSGGSKAMLEAKSKFEAGGSITFTPDGPRGPKQKVQPGVVTLAKLCRTVIIPVAVSSSRNRVLRKSWDQMQIPLPFGHLVVRLGAPIAVPEDADDAAIAHYRTVVEEALNKATLEADIAAGIASAEGAHA